MGAAMQAFLTKSALTFDMSELVARMTAITLTSGKKLLILVKMNHYKRIRK